MHGVLPVKIENGARYEYLKIVGVASAADDDLFYNNNLQTLNLGADKYILFFHSEEISGLNYPQKLHCFGI